VKHFLDTGLSGLGFEIWLHGEEARLVSKFSKISINTALTNLLQDVSFGKILAP
jgi:hypothetical protein